MKRFILLTMLLAMLLPAVAQRKSQKQEDIYYAAFADVLRSANDLVDGAEKACYFVLKDFDNDGVDELVIADANKLKTVYKIVNGKVQLISPKFTINDESLYWNNIEDFYVYSDADRSKDITLRHYPMFAYDINIAKNQFTVPGDVANKESVMKSITYDRMVFKPHVGNIHFVKAQNGSYYSDGNKIDLGKCYTYALNDATMTKKMFRGYSKENAVPIIVPQAWLKDHTPLQFTRYLSGEKKPKVDVRERKIIEQYYGNNYKIRKIEWVATCQDKNCSFYNVIFQPYKGQILVAFVCIKNGEVATTQNNWWEQDKQFPNTTQIGPDIDELFVFMPEIMVIADTKAGIELYVRYRSLEGMHYDVWREVADQWMVIQADSHYIMAY
ncbi:MAG: hypothetical protein J6X22_10750 [Muribaculaceae bacterium]|nr:hypothetical protein [Muribaculaceae bacterium]